MPEWMADLTIGTIITAVAGVLLVTGVIFRVISPVKKVTASLNGILAGWNGTPEDTDASGAIIKRAVPGVLAQMGGMADQLAALKSQIDVIHHETTPNHGGSMNDALKRIETNLAEHISATAGNTETIISRPPTTI